MKQYTAAENMQILREELRYFQKRLLETTEKEAEFINAQIKEIEREIKSYSAKIKDVV